MTGSGWLPTDPIRLVSANINNYLMAGFVRKTVIQFSAIYCLEVLFSAIHGGR
jgi:flagellar hook-associated protein FlgK